MATVRFDKLIDYWDPQLRKAFLEAIQNIRDTSQIEQLTQAIANGDINAALRAVNLDPANFRPIDKTLIAAYEAGGNATASSFPLLGIPGEMRLLFQFNVRNPQAEAWIMNYSSTLITEIIDEQQSMIRGFLTTGLERGANPRTTALDLVGRVVNGTRTGGVIGLTQSQTEWVQNYADELASDNPATALTRLLRDKRFDSTVLNSTDANEPLTADQIETMVRAYTNRALRYRAETIARSEMLTALHKSQQDAIQQAVTAGAISKDNVRFIWRTARDDRVRDSHAEMESQTVAMGEPFITGNGNLLDYPGDPKGPPEDTIQCRCWVEPSIDFLAGVT